MRQCGECSVCCTVGAVPEIEKPAHSPCPFIKTDKCGSCSIYAEERLPKTCINYSCSWLQGYGEEEDRPDKGGFLITENLLENQRYFTMIETKPVSFQEKYDGLTFAADVCEKTKIPIICVEYGKTPPNDTGDYVIIHDDILPRCSRIVGKEYFKISDSGGEFTIGIYELIKGG